MHEPVCHIHRICLLMNTTHNTTHRVIDTCSLSHLLITHSVTHSHYMCVHRKCLRILYKYSCILMCRNLHMSSTNLCPWHFLCMTKGCSSHSSTGAGAGNGCGRTGCAHRRTGFSSKSCLGAAGCLFGQQWGLLVENRPPKCKFQVVVDQILVTSMQAIYSQGLGDLQN